MLVARGSCAVGLSEVALSLWLMRDVNIVVLGVIGGCVGTLFGRIGPLMFDVVGEIEMDWYGRPDVPDSCWPTPCSMSSNLRLVGARVERLYRYTCQMIHCLFTISIGKW